MPRYFFDFDLAISFDRRRGFGPAGCRAAIDALADGLRDIVIVGAKDQQFTISWGRYWPGLRICRDRLFRRLQANRVDPLVQLKRRLGVTGFSERRLLLWTRRQSSGLLPHLFGEREKALVE
jgi:hypothetical protein